MRKILNILLLVLCAVSCCPLEGPEMPDYHKTVFIDTWEKEGECQHISCIVEGSDKAFSFVIVETTVLVQGTSTTKRYSKIYTRYGFKEELHQISNTYSGTECIPVGNEVSWTRKIFNGIYERYYAYL